MLSRFAREILLLHKSILQRAGKRGGAREFSREPP
jgi:hypothetical protein